MDQANHYPIARSLAYLALTVPDLPAAVDAGAVAAVGDARERDLDVLQFPAFAAAGLVAHLLQQLPALRLEQRAEFIGMEVGHGGSFLPSRKC